MRVSTAEIFVIVATTAGLLFAAVWWGGERAQDRLDEQCARWKAKIESYATTDWNRSMAILAFADERPSGCEL